MSMLEAVFYGCAIPTGAGMVLNEHNIRKNEKSKIKIFNRRKNLGFANNFLEGLKEIDYNFNLFSFCDQDDIWERDKLERGVAALKNLPIDKPALYGTNTLHINESGNNIIGKSINISKELSKLSFFNF